ncbi:MAG: GWxTD domain-containing protein [Bacteroidia bacterium]
MKRIHFLAFMLLSTCATSFGQGLQAVFTHRTFYSPEQGPYVETYLSVNGGSVMYVPIATGKFQASIEIMSTIKNETGNVVHNDRYNLLSPEVADTNNTDFNFLDQQRIQLPNGNYQLELKVTDKNRGAKSATINDRIKIEYYDNILAISDIQLVDQFSPTVNPSVITKSGYDVVPFADNFYPQSIQKLRFYSEIYNSNKVLGEAPYLVSFHIQSDESKRKLDNLSGFARQSSSPVNVLMREIPIGDLPSGNYNLVLEVRNSQNDLLATKSVFFQRSNRLALPDGGDFSKMDVSNTFASMYTQKVILADHIMSLIPIASNIESIFIDNQLKLSDLPLMQKFFYDFWLRRSPVSPESAWIAYRTEVEKVNAEFGTKITRGYATERGRVYLQYGAPNTISRNYTEPSAYPYEIWHYYKLNNQSNRKFVFYNPDLVTNDFTLLHSDALGEPFNNQWEVLLQKRNTQSRDYDLEYKGDYYGNKAKENFINPR